MSVHHPALVEHVRQLSAQADALRKLIEPPAPPPPRSRWPWLVGVAIGLGFALLTAYSLRRFDEAPPIVAPIVPTGDAAQRLWLP